VRRLAEEEILRETEKHSNEVNNSAEF